MADNRQFFYNNLISMGVPPQAALGAIYSLQGESHTALDPTAVGSGGDFGVAQWMGPRKAGLMAMAKALGTEPTDPNTQWQFMKSELVGPYSHVLQGLQNAKTAADATNIWTTQYEAPKVNNWQDRYNAGIKTTSLGDNNTLALKGGNDAPIATPAATPGTTLTSTPAAPQQSPAQMFAQGNIGGGLQQMFKQGMPQQAQQALNQAHPGTSGQQIAPMQPPNLPAHRPDESMAMQMLASLQNQGVKPPGQAPGQNPMEAQMGNMSTMGAMGLQYPYGMMGYM